MDKEEDLGFLYGIIFIGPSQGEGAHSRNVCVIPRGKAQPTSPVATSF